MCFHRRRQMWKMLLFLFMCHFFASRVSFTFTLAPHSLIFNNKACKSSPKQQQQHMPDNRLFFNARDKQTSAYLFLFRRVAITDIVNKVKLSSFKHLCLFGTFMPPQLTGKSWIPEATRPHMWVCFQHLAKIDCTSWNLRMNLTDVAPRNRKSEDHRQRRRNAFTNRFY